MKTKILILLIGVLVGGFVMFAFVNKEKMLRLVNVENTNKEVSEPVTTNGQNTDGKYYYYEMVVTKKIPSDLYEIFPIRHYIGENLFGWDQETVGELFPRMVFNTKNTLSPHDNLENYTYYAQIASKMDTTKIYENAKLKVVLKPMAKELIPYVKDTLYCEKRSDCSLRYSFCTQGAYNNFEVFVDVYGCEPS